LNSSYAALTPGARKKLVNAIEPFVRPGDRVAIVSQRDAAANLVDRQTFACGGPRFVARACQHGSRGVEPRVAAEHRTAPAQQRVCAERGNGIEHGDPTVEMRVEREGDRIAEEIADGGDALCRQIDDAAASSGFLAAARARSTVLVDQALLDELLTCHRRDVRMMRVNVRQIPVVIRHADDPAHDVRRARHAIARLTEKLA